MTTNRWQRTTLGLSAILGLLTVACGDDTDPPEIERSLLDPEVQAARICDEATGGAVGSLANRELDELSGVAASRIHAGLWAHNDKGDTARVFGLGLDGSDAGVWQLAGVEARDWEDIATGPGPDLDDSHVFVADIGDNRMEREAVMVHRFAEPDDWGTGGTIDEIDSFTLTYPDGPHDAEAFLVDPLSGDWYIIVKAERSERPPVFRAEAPDDPTLPLVLEEVATVDRLVTAADVTADGGLLALRTFSGVFVHPRPSGSALEAAFTAEPCRAPTTDAPRGEAITFVGLDSYVTISEGQGAAVDRFAVNG